MLLIGASGHSDVLEAAKLQNLLHICKYILFFFTLSASF